MSRCRGVPVPITPETTARFTARVIETSTCHIWMGAVSRDGYGRFWLRDNDRQRAVTPQRYAYELTHGPLARGTTLMHQCEVRICCRIHPRHVINGTQARNMQDAAWKGRARGSRPGLVDTRGPAGQSRAIQHALRAADPRTNSSELAELLRSVLVDGDPLAATIALFELDAPTSGIVGER